MQVDVLNNFYIFSQAREQLFGGALERLPHSLLLTGAEGLGKAEFAEDFARFLLCESPRVQSACGGCEACHWLAEGNHPDFRHVHPDTTDEDSDADREKSKKRGPGIIRIDQIRALEDFVFVGSHRMGRRVILITEAEKMNGAAANSILKILEEPPSSVYFIMVSSHQKLLLPTIRSRCRILTISTADAESASTLGLGKPVNRYLSLAAGASKKVDKWGKSGITASLDALIASLQNPPSDPATLAAQWDGLLKLETAFTLELLVEELQRWVFDLSLESFDQTIRYHKGWARPGNNGRKPNSRTLIGVWRELMQFRRSARHTLNQLLFLEDVATHYLRAVRS